MIIGLSGKKQSGKNTAANLIYSLYLSQLGIANKVYLSENGEIIVGDLYGDTSYSGIFDATNYNISDIMIKKVFDQMNPIIKIYSFADRLKQDICINLLGLSYNQCYGTDTQKNTLTHLKWEDMPGILTPSKFDEMIKKIRTSINKVECQWSLPLDPGGPVGNVWKSIVDEYGIIIHNEGPMTAREVMEFIGTDIFRKLYSRVWFEGTINKIKKENSQLAIICDCRFPNEVDAIKNVSGKVIRLTRNPFNSTSESETALDEDKYDWKNFDYIVDNKEFSLFDQSIKIKSILEEILQL